MAVKVKFSLIFCVVFGDQDIYKVLKCYIIKIGCIQLKGKYLTGKLN